MKKNILTKPMLVAGVGAAVKCEHERTNDKQGMYLCKKCGISMEGMTPEEQIEKVIQALDKVSEQGIRRILYTMIKVYPNESQIVIDAIILKQKEVI